MSNSRPTWDDVWSKVAGKIAQRSLCVRAQVGAVIVDTENRIVSTGYNGPPSGFEHEFKPCHEWCERARGHGTGEWEGYYELEPDYSDCPSLHAEANALIAADRSTWQGGTMYVLGDVCINCAKLIANSGLANLTIRRDSEDREYRNPHASYIFLDKCGIYVTIMRDE